MTNLIALSCGYVFNEYYYYYKEPALHEECFNLNIKAETTIIIQLILGIGAKQGIGAVDSWPEGLPPDVCHHSY